MMVYKSDSGVWMADTPFESVARRIAIDCMMALKLDHVNDFRTRDSIIMAISPRLQKSLDEAAANGVLDVLKRVRADLIAEHGTYAYYKNFGYIEETAAMRSESEVSNGGKS